MVTPILDLDLNDSTSTGFGYITTFTENGSGVPVADDDALIVNVSGPVFMAQIVFEGGALPEDMLSVSGPLPAGIIATSGSGGSLTLSTPLGASNGSFQNALHQVLYSNSSHNPNTSDRKIDIWVADNTALTNTSNHATATIHINAIDDAPIAQGGSFNGSEDTVITNALVASDVDNTQLSYIVVNQPAHGSVTINSNGIFSYTPDANFNGMDSFRFKANDGALDSNTATISLTVFPVADAPVITSNGGGDTATVSMPENTTVVDDEHRVRSRRWFNQLDDRRRKRS